MDMRIGRQQIDWRRVHETGQKRVVAAVALTWFVPVGLLPLPYLQAHAIVPAILPAVLACVLLCGLLIGDVVWHYAESGFQERAGTANERLVERRRRTLKRFLIAPLALLLVEAVLDIPQSAKPGVVLGVLVALAVLAAALVLLERSMKRAA